MIKRKNGDKKFHWGYQGLANDTSARAPRFLRPSKSEYNLAGAYK